MTEDDLRLFGVPSFKGFFVTAVMINSISANSVKKMY